MDHGVDSLTASPSSVTAAPSFGIGFSSQWPRARHAFFHQLSFASVLTGHDAVAASSGSFSRVALGRWPHFLPNEET